MNNSSFIDNDFVTNMCLCLNNFCNKTDDNAIDNANIKLKFQTQ